ncbi:hypothetical protein FCV25MIE_15935, partial [Fagus crenata]
MQRLLWQDLGHEEEETTPPSSARRERRVPQEPSGETKGEKVKKSSENNLHGYRDEMGGVEE